MEKELEVKFRRLWKRLGCKRDYEEFFVRLVKNYSQPHRYYHTLEHVLHCEREFEAVRKIAPNPLAVEYTLFGHDLVYDTKRNDNEDRSALDITQVLQRNFVDHRIQKDVFRLTMATKHDAIPKKDDERIVVDIDLSILGQPVDVFDNYETQIRNEYLWVPEQEYIVGRSKVLQGFLDRPAIYNTPFFLEKYEQQAQANLKRSIEKLNS